ncbi:MAG TPA: phosphoglucosamine mutase [Candidatus Latescibacteria bacterium]|mgnify:CR=1 FL=1|nr:phosphoglucosamine mutase [Candidatus Latescibacterota bacterium]|tara:strand:- start:426 stop:1790 length:1365 start_codon:yes stop_codon:yes gene_type:complete
MTTSPPLIISVSGIRGIVGASFTDDTVRRFAHAFATELPMNARILLARDTRPSGENFAAVAIKALAEAGCHVFDLGVCATPAAKLMVLELQAHAALILTASHNPADWNGMKLVRADGIFLDAAAGRRVESAYHRSKRRTGDGRVESVARDDVESRLLRRILDVVDVDAIRAAHLRVAVDPCNGTGALFLPRLFEALAVSAHFIHDTPDGQFAHEPEPIAENLVDLSRAVTEAGCQVGFATDPDADRVALVGETGQPLGEDLTLALAVQVVTERRKGPVVTTLSTSQVVTDAATANGCPVILTPVGEVHVVDAMVAEGAVIGGEGNGGVILTDVDPGRDAAVGIALILESLARNGRPLTELAAALPQYSIEKRKVSCSEQDLQRALDGLVQRYPEALRHPVQDGVKLYMEGTFQCPWIHLRPSNTEPVVRIIAECEQRQDAVELCAVAEGLLRGE